MTRTTNGRHLSDRRIGMTLCHGLLGGLLVYAACQVVAQPPVPTPFRMSGTVKQLQPGMLDLTDKTGKVWRLKLGDAALQIPLATHVTGSLGIDQLREKMFVQFQVDMQGQSPQGAVEKLHWLEGGNVTAGITEGGMDVEVPEPIRPETGTTVGSQTPGNIGRTGSGRTGIGSNETDTKGTKNRTDRTPRREKGRTPSGGAKKYAENGLFTVTGEVDSIEKNSLTVRVPKNPMARKGRLVVKLAPNAQVLISTSDLSRVEPGAEVRLAEGIEFNGVRIAGHLEIRLAASSGTLPTGKHKPSESPKAASSIDDARYAQLSTMPMAPRPVASPFFVLHTDASDRDAQMLLDRLNSIRMQLAQYFGRTTPEVIECYVVHDLQAWPADTFPLEAKGELEKKRAKTVFTSGGQRERATVYSVNQPPLVLHEAVLALCDQSFGGTGPTWYAHGIAEVARFWKEHPQPEVDVDPVVLKLLARAKTPRTVQEIMAMADAKDSQESSMGEKQAWYWALCQFLMQNPNYQRDFRELGLALMSGKPATDFEKVFGHQLEQMNFELGEFVRHVENGYRIDLCAWDWKHESKKLQPKDVHTLSVRSAAGWQPTGILVTQGEKYDFSSKGVWTIDGVGTQVDADGNSSQPAPTGKAKPHEGKLKTKAESRPASPKTQISPKSPAGPKSAPPTESPNEEEPSSGRLAAVVFSDNTLSDKIPCGVRGQFTAPRTGQLWVRCGEPWSRLSDNSGEIKVSFRMAR